VSDSYGVRDAACPLSTRGGGVRGAAPVAVDVRVHGDRVEEDDLRRARSVSATRGGPGVRAAG